MRSSRRFAPAATAALVLAALPVQGEERARGSGKEGVFTLGEISVTGPAQSDSAPAEDAVTEEQMLRFDNHVTSAYDLIKNGERDWKAVRAVKEGHVYRVPILPFNWFDRPPSANRLIGLRWVGHLIYPEVFDYDMRAEARRFYRLFYRIDLTDTQIDGLLARSTHRP